MALKIRLSRAGSKKRPVYRVVVADSRSPRDGRFIEKVGLFNPLLNKDNKDRVQLDQDNIKEWLSKGAKPTDKVAKILVGQCSNVIGPTMDECDQFHHWTRQSRQTHH